MAQLFTNNATSVLASSVTTGATSLTLQAGTGAKFPSPTNGDYFLLTLIGRDANGAENAWEIVKVTARATDTLTVARAQEGTSAVAWGTGTPVALRATAGTLQSLVSTDATLQANIDAKESLLSISQSIHSGAIVKAVLYDTSKDSDGGAWRKRCQDKSWYNEALNGAWLGQVASAAAAWALTGAVTGAYFQSTTDGKFYALGASSPAVTEVFRGNKAEFPEQAAIVAEFGRVVIYDLTQSNCPMWMVFKGTFGGTITCATACNSEITVGTNQRFLRFAFVRDLILQHHTSAAGRGAYGNIAARSASTPVFTTDSTLGAIVNNAVNDVAMTVLPDAPTDIATGLPIPTIAVATEGGVSEIQNTGTVNDYATSNRWYQIAYADNDYLFGRRGTTGAGSVFSTFERIQRVTGTLQTYAAPLPNSLVNNVSGNVGGAVGKGSVFNASDRGVSILKDNPATPAKAMVAYITSTYNSGWMVGDIRGAWLAGIVPEVLTASGELVTNGTFATDTSAWTAGNGATLSVVSNRLRVTSTSGVNGYAYQAIPTVVGKTYSVYVEQTAGTSSDWYVQVGTAAGGSNLLSLASASSVASVVGSFVATTTTSYINVISGPTATQYSDFDNVSVKLAEPDRSVKNNGLIVNGSITKAAVANGAQLVGYAGFSTSNFFEQPYNANLDFGTSDFCFMGWGNNPNGTTTGAIIDRFDVAQTGNRIYLGVSGGNWVLNCGANSPSVLGVAVPVGVFHYVFRRISGVLSLVVNNVSVYSAANTNSVTNAAAVLDIGRSIVTTTIAWPDWLSLLRVSATAPSDDQIAHIYNTEKHLFDVNAKCTIDGTSAAVTALTYDDVEDALHVGTSWGRSKFRDLVRVESAATSVGSITSISAGQGCHITAGASGGRFYQPALYLREELRRKEEARRALGKMPVFFDFDAATGQTAFALPKGWTVKAVYSAGTLKRMGSTKDYVVSYDGFVETVNFGVAPGNAAWVSIMAIRSN